jgi:coenzyme F420 hydrogenase subunit beta
MEAAGFSFDTSHGMKQFSDLYMTYASIEELDPVVKRGLHRVALVGTPCQIKSVRRMQVMGLVPSESIKFCFGLFCSGNFIFGPAQREQLAQMGGFSWDHVTKINIKETLQLHLRSGEIKNIELERLAPMHRYACQYCTDYSAEFADISFGGIGAAEGWTTAITRTPLGRAALADARSAGAIVDYAFKDNPNYVTDAHNLMRTWSARKKKTARHNRRGLTAKSVTFTE